MLENKGNKKSLDTAYTRCIIANVAKIKVPVQKTWRPTLEDVKLLAELKAKTGIMSETDVIRLALRALATQQGVEA